ncbi:MAG: hypothetical protein FJW94_02725 [Actinobacteria bacterium]|nr:hypothetical protein [Actinomycetota bacterium]
MTALVFLSITLGGVGAVAFRRTNRRSRQRRWEAAVLALGGELARSVRGGATLSEAFAAASLDHGGPLAGELESIQARLARGASLDEALCAAGSPASGASVPGAPEPGAASDGRRSLDDRRSWRVLIRACRLGEGSTGDAASVIDGAVASIVDDLELADETAALTSQARTSVWVLAALPVVGAAVFALVDPRVAGVLTTTGPGRVCLVVGLSLDAAGLWSAGRIVDRSMR